MLRLQLYLKAKAAMKKAQPVSSGFSVGAAAHVIRSGKNKVDKRIISGWNANGLHAEQCLIGHLEPDEKISHMIVVGSADNGKVHLAPPCGSCRDILLLGAKDGEILIRVSPEKAEWLPIKSLLPDGKPRSLDSKADHELFNKALEIMEKLPSHYYRGYTNEPQVAAILTSADKIVSARIDHPSFVHCDPIEAALSTAFLRGREYIKKVLLVTASAPEKEHIKFNPAGKSLQALCEESLFSKRNFEVIWIWVNQKTWYIREANAAKIRDLLPYPHSQKH
ncbi:MAG: hypothetical protein ABH860_05940 [bacterium]